MRTGSSSNRRAAALAAVALACAAWCPAQELEFSISPTPVGSGARAAGMADAFVAIADDATAASWNPAGLVQLERPEISIVGSGLFLSERFQAADHAEFDSTHRVSSASLNYLSAAYPLPFGFLPRNATISLNYQQKYDFNRDFSFALTDAFAGAPPLVRFTDFAFDQQGSLATLSPALGIELTHRLSVGVAVNLWRSTLTRNGWSQDLESESLSVQGPSLTLGRFESHETYKNFRGVNATAGLLWAPTDRWRLGLRFDSAFTGRADYRGRTSGYNLALPSPLLPLGQLALRLPTEVRETREIRFPSSIALGLMHRFNDRTTLAADVTRTDWNGFLLRTGKGQTRSLVDFSDLENDWTRTRFKPTYTVRLGCEHIFLPKDPPLDLKTLWTVRGGAFFDQEPATAKHGGFRWPGDNGSGRPDSFYGVTAGLGLQLMRRVNFDIAHQVRFGPGVNSDFIRGVRDFKEDVVQQRLLFSAVVYF